MRRQKFFNLIVTFLLLQPWLVSGSKTEQVLELRGSESLITPVYSFKSNQLKLKYKFSGSKLSSSIYIRVIPVKLARAKEILVYHAGNSSQTIPLKFKKFYFIISSLEGKWELVVQKR